MHEDELAPLYSAPSRGQLRTGWLVALMVVLFVAIVGILAPAARAQDEAFAATADVVTPSAPTPAEAAAVSAVVDVGLDGAMGGVAGGAGLLTKLLLYPLVQLRRRKPDGTEGDPLVPEPLQSGVVLALAAAGAAAFAVLEHAPLMPALSAAATGVLLARTAHEAGVRR